MIGLLRGPVVLRTGEGEVIVDVGGVGYRVTVTPATAAALVTGGAEVEQTLYVHTHVREDAIVLYGFAHDDERRCFEVLLGSHGVGPALALAIMAMLSPAALSTAVLEDDLETLCTVPGVGRKTAARLLIELKSRLELPDLSFDPRRVRRRTAPTGASGPSRTSRAGGPRRAERARLRPRRDPRCARRATRRCRRGRDASAGPARAGQPVSRGRAARSWPSRRGARGHRGRRRRRPARHRPDRRRPPRRSSRRSGCGRGSLTEFVGQVRAGRASRHRAAGGPSTPPAGRPHPLRRPAGSGQDLAGRHRGHRDGGRVPHHGRPRADPGRRPRRAADGPPGRRRPVHRRDPPAAPLGRGDALFRHGGRPARHPDRQGARRPARSAWSCPSSPWSGRRRGRASCRARLRDRFGFVGRLDLYAPADLRAIVERSARILKVEID